MSAYPVSGYTILSRRLTILPNVVQDELWMAEQCREAINCMENALMAPPMQLSREVNSAVRILSRLQARIRQWIYDEQVSGDREHWERVLEQLQTVQELAARISNPYSTNRRKIVEQARQHLQGILADGLY